METIKDLYQTRLAICPLLDLARTSSTPCATPSCRRIGSRTSGVESPMTPKSFHAMFGRIGVWAKMPFPIHPHMLRHGCGYALTNAGHDTRALQAWLGRKNIQHTVRYTELAPDRFKNFWR